MIQSKTWIIAEAGVNHNGSPELAHRLVEAAADAGADAVKFQTFRTDALVTDTAPKAAYQCRTMTGGESQHAMLKKLELDEETHKDLIDRCQRLGIEFLSTPFDILSVDLLTKHLGLRRIKIPSGEITNAPLLLHIAKTGKPVILSTGMSTLGEVEAALSVLSFGYTGDNSSPSLENFHRAFFSVEGQAALQKYVTLLHCTTEYPAPFTEANLNAMDTLRDAFKLPVGFSDHTQGIAVAIAAVAKGATVIEKHFTLDRSLPGPDHKASLEPIELKAMITGIRQVEASLGSGHKIPSPSEIANIDIARKSLTANQRIAPGEVFTKDNMTCKRPGSGISPMNYWDYIGRRADRSYEKDELIK